jgi:hypothetical protein
MPFVKNLNKFHAGEITERRAVTISSQTKVCGSRASGLLSANKSMLGAKKASWQKKS